MPTAHEITRSVAALIGAAGLTNRGDKITAQINDILTHALQSKDALPTSWNELLQLVSENRAGHDVTLILPALEHCSKTKAYFPELPGG